MFLDPLTLKFATPPAFASAVFLDDMLVAHTTREPWSFALDMIALAVLFGGFFVVGRLRAALAAEKIVADAWREERDAALSRAERKEDELSKIQEEVSRLRGLPRLDDVMARLDGIETLIKNGGQE